jgi:hypothetical protein
LLVRAAFLPKDLRCFRRDDVSPSQNKDDTYDASTSPLLPWTPSPSHTFIEVQISCMFVSS